MDDEPIRPDPPRSTRVPPVTKGVNLSDEQAVVDMMRRATSVKPKPGITPDMLSDDDRRRLAKLLEYAVSCRRMIPFIKDSCAITGDIEWAARLILPEDEADRVLNRASPRRC